MPYKSNEYVHEYGCMYAYIENIAAHLDYLSPMILAEPSNSLENLLQCMLYCGLTNKTVLHICTYVCIIIKASGGVARTLRYGQKLYFSTDIIISTYEYNKISKKQNKYNVTIKVGNIIAQNLQI